MKELNCKSCNGKWIVYDEDLNNLKNCPFCLRELHEKKDFAQIDTLDKVIYNALLRWGVEVLSKPQQLSGYILDIAPDLKKEIRIFCKSLSPLHIHYVIDGFNSIQSEADLQFVKLKNELMDMEGLSKEWSEFVYNVLSKVYSYVFFDNTLITLNGALIEEFSGKNYTTSNKLSSDKLPKSQNHKSAKPQIEFSDSILLQQADEFMKNRDYGQAMVVFRQLSDSGNVFAMDQIAMMYYHQKNYKKAWKWFLKAADLGNAESQYYVGLFNQKPIYVKRNLTTAIQYYKSAALQGYKKAQDILYYMENNMSALEKKKYNF